MLLSPEGAVVLTHNGQVIQLHLLEIATLSICETLSPKGAVVSRVQLHLLKMTVALISPMATLQLHLKVTLVSNH